MQERYNALKAQILQWAHEYYVLNESSVSDAVFDAAINELREIEIQSPNLITPDSPTQKVLGTPSVDFKSVAHSTPMLSLYTETEHSAMGARAFDARVRRDLAGEYASATMVYVGEPKYDGLAISLKYLKGKFTQAVTRGDGTTGEDVTHSVGRINGLPMVLIDGSNAISDYVEVRGEVLMTKQGMIAANHKRIEEGSKPFVNTRNAAAGVVRQHEPRPTDLAGLIFMPYALIDDKFDAFAVYMDRVKALAVYGFFLEEPYSRVCLGPEELVRYHQDMALLRPKLPYDIDGVVYKVNAEILQDRLGYLSREPKWACAHKYPPEEATTLLEDIDVQVGRTGKLTPVARLRPVFVGGAEVSNATLHNFFEIRKKNVQIGDTVIVRRAGDVIPEITGPLFKQTHYDKRFSIPKYCPVCASKVIRSKGELNHYCSGDTACNAQRKARFLHFVSRKAMDIDGMGESLVNLLVETYDMQSFTDIYLRLEMIDLTELGVGPKIAANLLKAIEASKEVPLERFLFGLGIRHAGENTCRILTHHFGSLDKIMTATYEELKALLDIGPIVARSIVNYFQNPKNADMVIMLASILLFKTTERVLASELFKGMTFVVTGSFPDVSRDVYEEFLRTHGAEVHGSVTKTTNYLVTGAKPSADKLAKAKSLGVEVLTQGSVVAMLGMQHLYKK